MEENKDFLEDDWQEEEEEQEENEAFIRYEVRIDKKQEALRIDKFLMQRIEGATRNKIQQGIENGAVLVNGEQVKSNYKIRPLDHIIVYDIKSVDYSIIHPEKMNLEIIYEDEEILLINKPAGLVVHPGSGNPNNTLVNGVAYYLFGEELPEDLKLDRIGLVHRIDKDTSGLILLAKTENALKELVKQFKARTVERKYLALVWGNVEEDSGSIEVNIGRNLRHRKLMDVFPEADYGKYAKTYYETLERLQYVSLLSFQLETGRTHQIRVHAKYMGHTLFGDTTYGGDKILKGTIYSKYKQFVDNNFKILKRQALHALELSFNHPSTGEKMHFNAPIPEDMTTVIDNWREYTKVYK